MNWISTEDKLPEVGEHILALDSRTHTFYLVFLCKYSNDIYWEPTSQAIGDELDFFNVTHWMSLPPLPETTE